MTGRPLGAKIRANQAERMRQYAELRDGGMRYVDVARELGMEERAGRRYERWYRSERGLPPAGSPGQFR